MGDLNIVTLGIDKKSMAAEGRVESKEVLFNIWPLILWSDEVPDGHELLQPA